MSEQVQDREKRKRKRNPNPSSHLLLLLPLLATSYAVTQKPQLQPSLKTLEGEKP
jgi:hypothetical protein